jgi:hypothetical protein
VYARTYARRYLHTNHKIRPFVLVLSLKKTSFVRSIKKIHRIDSVLRAIVPAPQTDRGIDMGRHSALQKTLLLSPADRLAVLVAQGVLSQSVADLLIDGGYIAPACFSPVVRMYLTQAIEVAPGGSVPLSDLFAGLRQWCAYNNYTCPRRRELIRGCWCMGYAVVKTAATGSQHVVGCRVKLSG